MRHIIEFYDNRIDTRMALVETVMNNGNLQNVAQMFRQYIMRIILHRLEK